MIRIFNARQTGGKRPRFSWKLSGNENQTAYRIRVRRADRTTAWDSGVIRSGERHNIPCGTVLDCEEMYVWSVWVEGEKGSSDTARGEAFFTEISSWQAQWAEPDRERRELTDSLEPPEPVGRGVRPGDAREKLDEAVYMRKCFALEAVPEKALLYATAHGVYALWVNGHLVSDLFAPGYTTYAKHIDYQIYDAAPYLRAGENCIGILLADGWYTGKVGAVGIGQQYGSESAILFQMRLKNAGGIEQVIRSDETMRWDTGAIRYADLYIGEYYDARHELNGWLSAEYDDSDWKPVRIRDFGYAQLVRQSIPPVRETREIRPAILDTPNGDLVLDAGENIVGYTSFALELTAGSRISLEHSETVDKDGNYFQNIIGQNKNQTDYYVAAADGISHYCPQFTYHGFRYVRVTGTQDRNPEHYRIHVIETPLRETGRFMCSDERLNRLQEIILRSQKGNLISIPTDCPQRERTGWTGDMQLYARTGCYEQDLENFLVHWLEDMEYEQLPDGQIPQIVPYMPSHDIMKPPGVEGVSTAGWSDAAVIVPWRLYEAYGDIGILKRFFPMMQRYMQATERMAAEYPDGYEQMPSEQQARQEYLWNTGFQFGDWLMPSIQMSGRSLFEVIQETGYAMATLYYAMTTDIMRQVCEALSGEDASYRELAGHYADLNAHIRAAFAGEYVNPDGTLKKDYQGLYVVALTTQCIPESLRPAAVQRLAEKIHENGDRLDTGFLSVPYLLPILHENGQEALANTLLFRDVCPSWLYEVKMGATTMWEYWNGYAEDGTPGDCSMNHFAFGCVGEYLYGTVLGIRPITPGYQKVRIQPDMDCGLSSVSGSFETVWGTVEVSWENDGEERSLDVKIPPNITAEVVFGGENLEMTCGTYHREGR